MSRFPKVRLEKNMGVNHKKDGLHHFFQELGKTPLLAHHPTCKYHENHLIWLGRLPLCLGCSMMGCGILLGLGFVAYCDFLRTVPFQSVLCFGVLLYAPAILQIKIQNKAYKVVARLLLGFATVLLVYAGLWLTPWSGLGILLRIGFLLEFALVWKLTLKARSRYSSSPCDRCPEGKFPVCSYTLKRIPKLANQYFAETTSSDSQADEVVRALQATYYTQNQVSTQ